MPRTPTPLPDDLPLPVFTLEEARSCGVDRSRVLASDLRRLRRGLYCLRTQPPTARDVAVALCRNYEELVVVGRSAAIFWGMPVPMGTKAFPLTVHAPQRDGGDTLVTWTRQQLPAAPVVTADGLRILNRSATWSSLGSSFALDDLVIIADHLLRIPRPALEQGRVAPYATVPDLMCAVDSSPRTGRARLREALALARVGSDSPMETRARLAFGRAGLPEPVLNRPLHTPSGQPIRVFDELPGGELGPTPDAQWPQFRVAAEYDGDHHLTREQKDRDVRRTERYRQLGWIPVVLTSTDMRNRARGAVHRVRAALVERGWRPTGA